MNELRCGNCGYWVGESTEAMVFVETVDRSVKCLLSPPRDMRICKSCNRVNVFIPRGALDRQLKRVVGSAL